MANLRVEIVAPDRRVFSGEATGVRAPGTEGSFAVLYNHAPMIAALAVGPIFVTRPDGEVIIFATSGGFLEVLENTVTILAETAEPASEIDVEKAREAELEAIEQLRGSSEETDREKAARALEHARSRLRIAVGQVGSKR